jgi:hypothetical protein
VAFLIGYTIVAAVVAAVVLVLTFWQWAILLTVVLLVLAVVRGNLQELRFLRAGLRRERERTAAEDRPPPDVRDPRAASTADAHAELDGLGPGDHG